MSAEAETLAKALALALDLVERGETKVHAAEEAAKEFDLGPLDEEWLLNHLTQTGGTG